MHKLTNEYASTTLNDVYWNASSGSVDEQVTILVLLDLAKNNSQVDAILSNSPSSYGMTNCEILFSNQKEYLQHKVYANFTLKGNARQLARSSYYDINYTRVTQSMDNVKAELCSLLTNQIGTNPSEPIPQPQPQPQPINDACLQGQTPIGNVEITADNEVCLKNVSNGNKSQMALFVPADKVGSTLEIILSHGSGNGDLLHKHDNRPNSTTYDHISKNAGNEERILVTNVQKNWNYIHVQTDTAFLGVTLLARYIQ